MYHVYLLSTVIMMNSVIPQHATVIFPHQHPQNSFLQLCEHLTFMFHDVASQPNMSQQRIVLDVVITFNSSITNDLESWLLYLCNIDIN